jgi:fructose-1,6-bisphosphatase I
MMVYSTGNGVHGFTLDPEIGEFLLSHENMMMPNPPGYYSVNHSYFGRWSTGVQEYIRWLQGRNKSEIVLSERYIGSLVADFHRNLQKGGVFLYPAETRKPNGKLRLLYEAAPLAFLAEQAGGYASNGRMPILDIEPTSLHQRVPLFIGNRPLVEMAEELIAQHDPLPPDHPTNDQ